MKNVRVWFSKEGTARYISHLDLNRVMHRAIHQAKLPIWYTEGFNPHPFITFALPLSLGFTGKRESMDMRLLEETFSFNKVIEAFNAVLPDGIHVFSATQPVMKPGKIAFADFEISLSSTVFPFARLLEMTENLLAKEKILIDKKTKSGIKEIDLKPSLNNCKAILTADGVLVRAKLPAGSVQNTNPALLVAALEKQFQTEIFSKITRLNLYDESGEPFA